MIKKAVVEKDERESGLRKILNFGHTFGHAVEAAEEMRGFYHGECVAIGMMATSSEEVKKRLIPVLKKLSLPYSYDGDCTLILDKADVATEYLLEQVVDFNIFNNTIYYMQEGEAGYDIYSCDKDGGNRTLLASVPVAFEESDYGCSTNMLVGEGFIVCEVYAKYLEGTYRYFVDIETGEVKEIEFL
jgi:hypothetical protein